MAGAKCNRSAPKFRRFSKNSISFRDASEFQIITSRRPGTSAGIELAFLIGQRDAVRVRILKLETGTLGYVLLNDNLNLNDKPHNTTGLVARA